MSDREVPEIPMAKSIAILTMVRSNLDCGMDMIQEAEDAGDFLLPAMTAVAAALFARLEREIGTTEAERFVSQLGIHAIAVDEELAAIVLPVES